MIARYSAILLASGLLAACTTASETAPAARSLATATLRSPAVQGRLPPVSAATGRTGAAAPPLAPRTNAVAATIARRIGSANTNETTLPPRSERLRPFACTAIS